MTLMQLRYMIAISETGSLNKAADLLYISQPSLTSAVKELEKYGKGGNLKKKFGVSTQHYSFAVKAFVDMAKSVWNVM